MSIFTVNRWLAAKGQPYSQKVLELLLSIRESLSICLVLNFTCLFQYYPSILLKWEFGWIGKLSMIYLCCPRRFCHCFVACWFRVFILSRYVYSNWKWRLLELDIFLMLSNFNYDIISRAFSFLLMNLKSLRWARFMFFSR